MKKQKKQRLSDIKFDKKNTIKDKDLKKAIKRLNKKIEEIDEKRMVDLDKLSKTYINI